LFSGYHMKHKHCWLPSSSPIHLMRRKHPLYNKYNWKFGNCPAIERRGMKPPARKQEASVLCFLVFWRVLSCVSKFGTNHQKSKQRREKLEPFIIGWIEKR
jgi:hypothetical protein